MSKSLDLIKQENEKLSSKLANAVSGGDDKAAMEAMSEFAQSVSERILEEARAMNSEQMQDASILAARGLRVLTSKEIKYYNSLVDAMKSPDPKMALTDIEIAMPETTIDSVFDDIAKQHPLLSALDFRNTNGKVKMIVNAGGVQLAVWGKLTEGYKKELAGAVKEIDSGLYKLSAFLPVSKSMLDLGPVWLDRYVRAILSEAIACGAEKGYISGTGKDEPVGMDRIVGKNAVVQDGVYTRKAPVKVTSFDPESYGSLISQLAVNSETGAARTVSGLILVVNPIDYFRKVMPATTMLAPAGTYVSGILPVPTQVIQSEFVAEGEAVIGIGKRYFAPLGTAQGGKIEYDDSVQFLEDNRVYAAKLYGAGMALDNNAFLLLDISKLKPLRYSVSTLAESLDTANEGA